MKELEVNMTDKENKRYKTVLKWFEEYGLKVTKKSDSSANWHETMIIDTKGIQRKFEITNNHIWYIKHDRISFGKTKKELYYNLEKRGF